MSDTREAQIRYQNAKRQVQFGRQVAKAVKEGNVPEGIDEGFKKNPKASVRAFEKEAEDALAELRVLSVIHSNFNNFNALA